jgi:glycosyltransferase involved in cell wall biosynthesis
MQCLVAIHCLVYNHEPYLRDCLEGFVMQKTNFPFVAIVHDDASTDNSAAIIREYEEKYSDIIKPIYEKENQWRKGTLTKVMNTAIEATGAKYVAMCEGDDYWTDPLKLQKQVDFLESHIDYGLVHTYRKIDMAGRLYETPLIDYTETKETLLQVCSIATCTVMYTTEIFNLIKDEYTRILRKNNLPMSDYPLWLLIAEESKIGYLPDATANYRMLPESASHSNSKTKMYNFDKGAMLCKSIFFHRFKERGNLTGDSIRNYYEMAFHLRKRMFLSYGWTAREQIWPLLKLILYYPMIFYRSIVRKLKKN